MEESSKPHTESAISNNDSNDDIQFLQDFFNKNIDDLKTVHPIKYYLTNTAPWTIKWLDEFVHILKQIKNDNNNLSILQDKLKSEEKFREGLIFLYNYKCYSENDCNIDFILEDNKNRSVDIEITDLKNNYRLFVECTEVHLNDEERNAQYTFSIINQKAEEERRKYDLQYIGEILLEYISHPETILKDISLHANIASKKGYSELVNDYIRIAFSKKEQINLLMKFSEVNKIQFDPSSLPKGNKIFLSAGIKLTSTKPTMLIRNTGKNPTFNDNFIIFLKGTLLQTNPIQNRIITKIKEKRKQIKKSKVIKGNNSVSALFIESHDFFRSQWDYNSKLLEQHIIKQQSIDLLIIYDGHPGGFVNDQQREINKNIFYINQSIDLISRELIIIKNDKSINLGKTDYYYQLLQKIYLTNTLLH